MEERKGVVTFKGEPITLLGPEIKVGDKAPDFRVIAQDLSEKTWQDLFQGKPTLLSAVPSLDTGICDAETRRFNEEAGKLGDKVSVITLSVDLPFAQKRWCGAAGIENVDVLSDYRDLSFGDNYGCHIKELRLLARAVFVVDGSGEVRYVQYVPEIGQHPDYDSALSALTALL
ncbi:MAG: thiol peroxidase [Calditrichaeota bacterium]|nr:MAG: thiol peroxidase [Calditrichota bacterium]